MQKTIRTFKLSFLPLLSQFGQIGPVEKELRNWSDS